MSESVLFILFGLVAITSAHPPFLGRGLGRPFTPPCGLPPFTDKLPADVQKKLHEIWKDYKNGEKCYNEQGETRELLHSLPKEVRKAIFKHPPLPRPLTRAPKEVQQQFKDILEDKSIPCEDKFKKMHELAQKLLKGETLTEFNDFYNKIEEHKKHIEALAEKLSPEAKQAYDKLKDLRKQRYQIYQNLSEPARDELFDLWQEKCYSFPRPR